MRGAASIVARLRERLLVAPMSPSTAAAVLCSEHPCADTGVTTHLVKCLEGNGVLLPLPAVLALVRCGYTHEPGSDHHAALRSQWGPMEETLFTALWIRLRRPRAEEDAAWGHVLAPHPGLEATAGHEGCGPHSPNALLQTLRLLVDAAAFVHHSSLASKALRLRLLADAVSPSMRHVDRLWRCLNELDAAVFLTPEQLHEIGRLAGKCLRLYGKCILSFHHVLSAMLLAGTSALSQTLQSSNRDGACVKAPVVLDAFSEMRDFLVGLLSRAACEREFWTGSIERWMEVALQLAERFTSAAAPRIKRVGTDGTAATFRMPRALHAEAMNAFSILLATYHRSVATELASASNAASPAMYGSILERGLGVLRQLLLLQLQLVLGGNSAKAFLPLEPTHGSDAEDGGLSVRAWCACCEAAQVLYALSSLCEKCGVAANACGDAEVRSVLLRDALRRLTCVSASGAGNHAVLPITFYLTLVRILRAWRGAPNAAECVSPTALWDAARVALPGSLAASPPPVQHVVYLLEELCSRMLSSASVAPKPSSPRVRKETTVVRVAVRAMWGNCLSHMHDRLRLGSTVLLDDEAAFARGMLHIGAAANCAQAGAVVGLFDEHPFLLGQLCDTLLPVERGMRLCFDAVRDLQVEAGSDRRADEGEEDEEADYRAVLSGGAYWFVCEACLRGRLWHETDDVIVGASRGVCHCVLRRRSAADVVAAYVEFFASLLLHGKAKTCGSDPFEEPFVALQSLCARASPPAAAALDCNRSINSLQHAGDAAPSFRAAASFLIECHHRLLLLPPCGVLPSHARRMLRAVFAVSPRFFACVPELSQFLLRRLLNGPLPAAATANTAAAAAPATGSAAACSEAVEEEGACALIAVADPRELWEVLLWACAAKIARLGVCLPTDTEDRGAEHDSPLFSRATPPVRLDDDAEEPLRLLYGTSDDGGDVFFAARRQVLRRALQLLQG
ncbi:uncharacterized protein Tco025E_05750 [Trypanosoma conorhini]|uniref:Uncharacterized protein n=1 Tax=Trypanosoma conorhini TaxID=83891 RepID=A0A3R7L2C9_9TRYP|nr:uncharacterized protein Tco025E_05750 [Trypanosoma conorhini]RNF14958.1 hypothetical protein Tco025E_05750 [Trypanosoma conorhini]